MLIRSICLGFFRQPSGPSGLADLAGAARTLRDGSTGLQQVQSLCVLRHIPTDSVNDSKAPAGAAPGADDIACVLELYFADDAALRHVTGGAAWAAFMEQVGAAAQVLFSFDTQSNVPIAPRAAALRGGFRRWMLLGRKMDTAGQFRDAWWGRHADLVKQLPRVDGYLQNLVVRRYDATNAEVGYDVLPVDGIAQLCYADEAAMNDSYTSDARLPLRDDGRALLGRITTMLVQGEVLA